MPFRSRKSVEILHRTGGHPPATSSRDDRHKMCLADWNSMSLTGGFDQIDNEKSAQRDANTASWL